MKTKEPVGLRTLGAAMDVLVSECKPQIERDAWGRLYPEEIELIRDYMRKNYDDIKYEDLDTWDRLDVLAETKYGRGFIRIEKEYEMRNMNKQ